MPAPTTSPRSRRRGGLAPRELVVGVDFGGPASAGAQRRKILAVAAERSGTRRWVVPATGLNARLASDPPGWTAGELAEALTALRPAPSIVGADFPFCVPCALLDQPGFFAPIGPPGPLRGWAAFNAAVRRSLPLSCPADYAPFRAWRRRDYWLRRDTDVVAGAHPALKDRFQVLFNMTLLGNAFLATLARTGRFDVVPFQARGRSELVEVYPGHAMRALGVRDYKRAPGAAIDAILRHLRSRGVALTLDARVRGRCEAYDSGRGGTPDHDAADALVAACIAILKREGLARELVGERTFARAREGAIWSVAPDRAARRAGSARASAPATRRRAASACGSS